MEGSGAGIWKIKGIYRRSLYFLILVWCFHIDKNCDFNGQIAAVYIYVAPFAKIDPIFRENIVFNWVSVDIRDIAALELV